MKTNYRILVLAGVMSLLLSCQPKKEGDTTTTTPEASAPAYPALGNEEVSLLYSSADQVDIIFYYLPISVNQDDPSSVKSTALYVSPASPKLTQACQPIARLTWMKEGTIFREADVHMEEGCQYLLFMEKNAPVAANALSQAGVDFFKNVISQVEQQRNKNK